MKRRGFGAGRWNGVGGKINETDKSIEDGARREAKEEIGVSTGELKKIAELSFYFPHNSAWDQMVHVYFCERWIGIPAESDDMKPNWFSASEIPYKKMWPDDEYWLGNVLKGDLIKATFKFGENDVILDKEVNVVDRL
jgi:8-oxo-dGTP diphosphatase/2-hydroxy-dATP diphosphatase